MSSSTWLTAIPAPLDSEAVRAGLRRQEPPAHRRDRQPRQRHHCSRGEGTIDEGLACSQHPGSETPAKQYAPLWVTIESLEGPTTAVGHTSAGEPQKCHHPDRSRVPRAGKPGSARPTPRTSPKNPHRLGHQAETRPDTITRNMAAEVCVEAAVYVDAVAVLPSRALVRWPGEGWLALHWAAGLARP
jgi:hypothetical protein